MAVSKRTRFEVLKRDNYTCRYCRSTEGELTLDHVVPVALGGSDKPDNLVAACRDCNAGKSSASPDAEVVEDVTNDSMRWAAAMRLAAERATEKRRPAREYVMRFAEAWDSYMTGSHIYDPQPPASWESSIESFYTAGLPIDLLLKALDKSMARGQVAKHEKFRYMAGIGWSMLTELQEEARLILREEDRTDG